MGAVALAVATPLLFVYYRRGGASLLRNTIVFCHGCGLVRIAGREDDGEGRRFREIRSSLDFFFRPLRLAFLFFVVVWVAGWFLPGRIPPGTFMILTLTGLASYAIHSVRRRFCPPPGPWWRNLLPRPGGHR